MLLHISPFSSCFVYQDFIFFPLSASPKFALNYPLQSPSASEETEICYHYTKAMQNRGIKEGKPSGHPQ
jgi:hypothetical protein